jgi:Fic family protein
MRGRLVRLTWQSNPMLYAPARYRRACYYDAFLPDPISDGDFPVEATIAGIVSDAENAIRGLNSGASLALAPLAKLLLRSESIASSKIEGLQLGLRSLARAEALAEVGGGASRTAAEIIANIEAMELAIRESAEVETFGTREIESIHLRLMQQAHPRMAGKIRASQNWIGGNDYNPCGADFVPPPPDEVGALLEDLCDAINDESLPPLMQAAIVHAQFETIHPFDDGNGRTGRALIHVVLRRRGIAVSFVPPISVVLAAERDRYIAGLTEYRTGKLSVWLEQFAVAAARASRLAIVYLKAVAKLTDHWKEQLEKAAAPRADAAAWAVISVLPAHPVITTSVAERVTGRARSAIHVAIAQLEEAGVLTPVSRSRRNRSWEAAGLLDLVEGLENNELPGGEQ